MDRTVLSRREALGLLGVASFAHAQAPADITLKISEVKVELAKGRVVQTLAYNDSVPGPLLRMKEGRQVSIKVVNETFTPEMLHWHGFHIPPNVDGAHEEGTPMIQGKDSRIYTFTPGPSGTRWYHTHAMAGHDLKHGAYTGQFGMVVIEPKTDPARYDKEVPLLLHEWEPSFDSDMAMDVSYKAYSINGKMLGAGAPVRVKPGQKVLFRIVNASATMPHQLALSGHVFRVIAMDGNPVAVPGTAEVLDLAPGERVDAIVEMKNPGVWVLGETDEKQRKAGAGIVVEYALAKGRAVWKAPTTKTFDYLKFGKSEKAPLPDNTIPIVIEPRSDGNLWAINGKSYPNTDIIRAKPGVRNRMVFDNKTDMAHPVHLHRHTLEITNFAGRETSGVFKDVIMVPAKSKVEADFLAEQAGPSLFHCHQQFHMDFGFMALMRY